MISFLCIVLLAKARNFLLIWLMNRHHIVCIQYILVYGILPPQTLWMVIIIMLYLSMVLLDLLGSCPYFRNLMLVLSSLIFKHWLKIYLTERSSFFKVMAAVTLLTTHSYTISKVWDTTSHFVSLYAGTKWCCRTQTPAYCGDRAHITSWK